MRHRDRLHRGLLRHAPKLTGPMRRSREDRIAGGVAAAVAVRFGRDVMLVRILFALAALLTVGMPLYVVMWLLLPMEGDDGSIAARALKDRRGIGQAIALATLLAALFVVISLLGAGWANGYAWAIVTSAALRSPTFRLSSNSFMRLPAIFRIVPSGLRQFGDAA